jgi:hypothetical protein
LFLQEVFMLTGMAFFSPISSPLTTHRVTVEVFDPASTRVSRHVTTTVDMVFKITD